MKQLITTAALLLITVFSFHAKAQQVSDEDLKDIEKVYADFGAAFEKFDAQAATNLYTENGVHIDPTGKITRGRKGLLTYYIQLFSYFKSLPKPDKMTHQDSDWNTRYLAPGLIEVSYTSADIKTYGDKTETIKFSMAIILKRIGDKWLAEQVAMTPVTETGKL